MKLLTIDQAANFILDNQIVAVPTDTVYGLFGLADSSIAVNNVYQIKNRPGDNPLICHFHSLFQILNYVKTQPEYIIKLIDLLGPSPLTYVMHLQPGSPLIPACAGLETVCCRIPDNEICLKLLRQIDVPLFGPSANTSTRVTGVFPKMIDQDLGNSIAGIIDGGKSPIGLESTIIDTTTIGQITILRPGKIGKLELQSHLQDLGFGDIIIQENQKSETVTPGSKYQHYSPKAKIYLGNYGKDCQEIDASRMGLKEYQSSHSNYISLGSRANLEEVCANFYFNLYRLDQAKIEYCFFDKASYDEIGKSDLSIAKALLNRLNKVLIEGFPFTK